MGMTQEHRDSETFFISMVSSAFRNLQAAIYIYSSVALR